MYAVSELIQAELQACTALADFEVRIVTGDDSKRTVPAIEVALEGVQVPDTTPASVKLSVAWGIHLIVQRGDAAVTQLDTAFAAVIATLQGYKPGRVGGRVWTKLQMAKGGTVVSEPDFADQGLAEYAVIFETSAVYDGRTGEA